MPEEKNYIFETVSAINETVIYSMKRFDDALLVGR
jgi:hypothetical protein